ncbi:MAG: LysM peptidoglycan-binding protein [Pedosphaera sp.]|nr:LysM peptidoglycan-binding protein [Pedosphaera sp.]
MNNSNPIIPQGSALEQKNKGRTRVKVAVFCVLAFHGVLLGGMLIAGCKREETTPPATQTDTGLPSMDTNSLPNMDTNLPTPPSGGGTSNTAAVPPYVPPAPPVVPTPAGTEYVVAHGDSFYTIGKKFGVSIKAIQAANPTMVPTKLKAGDKLQIPAAGVSAAGVTPTPGSGATMSAAPDTSDVYVVKSGDSLTKIAKEHGTTVKAIRAANDLKTDKIKVSQHLKLPAKAAVAPVVEPAPAPATMPTITPLPSASAPAH